MSPPTTIATLEDDIRGFIARELLMDATAVVADDDELLMSGLVDSLGIMRLLVFIEQRCSVEVPAEDVVIENFQSIRDMTQYLKSRGAA